MKDMNRHEEMKENDYSKAKVFFNKKIPVHVSLKSGTFYNGLITEEPSIDFFFMEDKEEGKKLIFYVELKKPLDISKGKVKV